MKNRTYHPRNVLVDGYTCRTHPSYNSWAGMLGRCADPTNPAYKNWGGRGITVCKRWYHFANFAADMGIRPLGTSIERKNNDKGYSKSNCQWHTRSQQCFNRRVFKNSKSGVTGVVKYKDRYIVRFDYEKIRYMIGRTSAIEDAEKMRTKFLRLFFKDRAKAIASIKDKPPRVNSSTLATGITTTPQGGYIARCSIDGERRYVGYFKSIQEAEDARLEYLAVHTA